MTMKTLTEIEDEVDRLAEIIGATGHLSLPTYGWTREAGYSHVEADARGYHLVTVERGEELERITTNDLDDLLYHIFADVTFDMANAYELAHRIETRDSRRVLFRKQVELLSELSEHWGPRQAQEQEEILREAPFDDELAARIAREFDRPSREPLEAPASQTEFWPEPEQQRLPKANEEPSRRPPRTIPAAKISLLVNARFLGWIGIILFGIGLFLQLWQKPAKTSGLSFICCSIYLLCVAWALRPAAQQNQPKGNKWVLHALAPVLPLAIWYGATRSFPDADGQKVNRTLALMLLILVAGGLLLELFQVHS